MADSCLKKKPHLLSARIQAPFTQRKGTEGAAGHSLTVLAWGRAHCKADPWRSRTSRSHWDLCYDLQVPPPQPMVTELVYYHAVLESIAPPHTHTHTSRHSVLFRIQLPPHSATPVRFIRDAALQLRAFFFFAVEYSTPPPPRADRPVLRCTSVPLPVLAITARNILIPL